MAVTFKEIRTRPSADIPYGDPDPVLQEEFLNNQSKWDNIRSKIITIEYSNDELVETVTYEFDSVAEFREIMEDRALDPFLIQFLGRQKEYRKRNNIAKETVLLDEANNVIETHTE